MRKVFNKSEYPEASQSVLRVFFLWRLCLEHFFLWLGLFYLTWLLKRFKLCAHGSNETKIWTLMAHLETLEKGFCFNINVHAVNHDQ